MISIAGTSVSLPFVPRYLFCWILRGLNWGNFSIFPPWRNSLVWEYPLALEFLQCSLYQFFPILNPPPFLIWPYLTPWFFLGLTSFPTSFSWKITSLCKFSYFQQIVLPDLSGSSYYSFKFNLLELVFFSSFPNLTVFERCLLIVFFISLLNHAKYFWPLFFHRQYALGPSLSCDILKKNLFIADTKAGKTVRLRHARWMIFSVPLIIGLVYHKQQERKVSTSTVKWRGAK